MTIAIAIAVAIAIAIAIVISVAVDRLLLRPGTAAIGDGVDDKKEKCCRLKMTTMTMEIYR